jgi:hypothetical protein
MLPRAFVVVGVALALLAGLPALAPGDTSTPTRSAALDCDDPIDAVPAPPSLLRTFGGTVALQTSTSTSLALQGSPISDPAIARYHYFSKTPVYVRTNGKSATISVTRSSRGRVAPSWGNTDADGVATNTFTFGPCSGSATWIGFPGGYYLTRRGCFDFVVRAGRKNTRIRVGLGAPCPGQQPPPTISAP